MRGGFADVSPSGLTILAERALPVEEITDEVLDHEILQAEMAYDATDDSRAPRTPPKLAIARAARGEDGADTLIGAVMPETDAGRFGARFHALTLLGRSGAERSRFVPDDGRARM